jgi:rubrerythrin
MSKITFRADDDLIDRLEEFEASKSEVMREALRTYLDGESERPTETTETVTDTDSIDELIADRVDTIIADRLETAVPSRQPQDVNVNISLDGDSGAVTDEHGGHERASDTVSEAESADVSHESTGRKTAADEREDDASHTQSSCAQCGESLASGHVYCPNCGEKASRRVFCDCGDELRSDWGFCPGCGRRTPAADVLDQHRSGANRE